MTPELLGDVRPEWIEAVDAAWYNWRFLLAGALPLAIFFTMRHFDLNPLPAFPVALLCCWFFASWGVYNVTDVMCDNAVTDDEFGIAICDTGRTFAPILTIPPLAFVYTLFAWPFGELQHLIFRVLKRRWSHESLDSPRAPA